MSIDQKWFDFFRNNRGLPFRTMTVFNFLLEATLFGSLLILLVLLLRAVLRRNLGNRAVYMAWLLVAIRLLVPLALPNPMMNELRPTWSEDLAARPVADQVRVRTHDAISGLSRQLYNAAYSGEKTNQVLADAANVAYNVNVVSSYGWLGKWIFLAYLSVDGAALVYMAVQNIRFRQRLRAGRVAQLEGEELALYHDLCKQRGIKPIPVWYVDPLPSACLVGIIKPYIALPLTLTKEELSQVLTHEICHQKAGDNWWGMVRNLCCIVHWFNPLVWLAARCSRTDCELACDERVTEKMDREQRVAYAGTLVLAAARRNAPGMSVLATGMTMTGKRLKQRVKAIVQSRKKLVWLAAVSLVLLAAVTLGAFFTAERFEEGYDVRMRKALPRFSLDGKMPVVVPENVAFSQRTITNEEEALVYAKELLETPYLGLLTDGKIDPGSLRISSFEGEWRVELPEAPYGFEMYFDSNGTLLYWDECLPLASEDYPYEMELVQEPVEVYIRQFAKHCLGDPPIAYVRIDEQRYTLEQRYIYGRAVAEGDKGLFTFAMEPYGMTLTGFHDVTRTTFGDGTFFSHAVSNLRNWLFSHTDITAEDLAAGSITVEAVGAEALLTAYTVKADQMSPAFLSSARNEMGEQSQYTYQLLTDRYGADTGYRTKEAYLRREEPVITQAAAKEAAVTAAAAIFQTEIQQVQCSTADHYPEYGWYEAYCSHQKGETKELITLRVDEHDGSILSMEAVITDRELQRSPGQLKDLPVPAAPLETIAPAEEDTEKPDGDTIAFEADGAEYLLPICLLKDSAMRNDPPGTNDLTLEAAGRIAAEAVCAEYGLSFEELTHYYLRGQFITEETVQNAPKWWFNLVLQSTNECRYTIGITSPEGEVEHLGGPGDGNG